MSVPGHVSIASSLNVPADVDGVRRETLHTSFGGWQRLQNRQPLNDGADTRQFRRPTRQRSSYSGMIATASISVSAHGRACPAVETTVMPVR
jgi:hypothetical protein